MENRVAKHCRTQFASQYLERIEEEKAKATGDDPEEGEALRE